MLNPKAIFSDRELTSALANPQTLDATGRSTNKIWTDGKYSMQVNDSAGVQVFQDLDRGEDTSAISITGLTSVAGGNTITAVSSPVITSYVDKSLYIFTAAQDNTGAATLNIDGVGAKAIVQNNDLAIGAGRIKTDDNVTVQYNSTNDNFAIVNQKTNLIGYVAKSSTYTVLPEDLGFLIDCTAALTLNLTAAASLGAGWSFSVKGNGGLVTIDPNGAETIDGQTTIEIQDGSSAEITCDGTNFHTVLAPSAGSIKYRTISSADTVITSDRGKVIDCTATLALALTAAATLKEGFFFYVKGNGGTVAIDPNGAETIDGNTTLAVADGSKVGIMCDGTNFHTFQIGTAAWPGQLFGLTTSNGTDTAHDIDIAIGQASSDDALSADIVTMNLSTAITKQIDAAWAVGTGAGGMDAGTVAVDTWYHIFLIMRTDTGIVDALFSTSATSPTMPSGYDKKRRIGSVFTDGSANIIAYTQRGDEFLWDATVADVAVAAPGVSAVTRTMTVPTGLKVIWNGILRLSDGSIVATSYGYISSLDKSDEAPSVTISQVHCVFTGATGISTNSAASALQVRTNTSAQVRSRTSSADLGLNLGMVTLGWFDDRGRLE